MQLSNNLLKKGEEEKHQVRNQQRNQGEEDQKSPQKVH